MPKYNLLEWKQKIIEKVDTKIEIILEKINSDDFKTSNNKKSTIDHLKNLHDNYVNCALVLVNKLEIDEDNVGNQSTYVLLNFCINKVSHTMKTVFVFQELRISGQYKVTLK